MSVWGTGLLKGLYISMRNMFRGPITVQYPKQKVELPERSRWTVAPTLDEDGNIKCTACLTCVRVCPDHVLDMELTVDEEKNKHIDFFRYELGACMMCGLCVEACPFGALHQTHDYELARYPFSTLTYNLIEDTDAAKPKRKSAEGAAAKPKPAPKPAEGDAPAAPADAPGPAGEQPAPEQTASEQAADQSAATQPAAASETEAADA